MYKKVRIASLDFIWNWNFEKLSSSTNMRGFLVLLFISLFAAAFASKCQKETVQSNGAVIAVG